RVELLEEIVLLVVERRPAEVGDSQGPVDADSLVFGARRLALLPGFVAGAPDALGDHLHRLLERDGFPPLAAGRPVEHPLFAMVAGDELERRRSLGTEASLGDRRIGVALDVDDLLALDVDELAAPDGTIGTDGADGAVRRLRAWLQRRGPAGHRGAIQTGSIARRELPQDGPPRQDR